jgi:glycine dehydrogenase
LIFQKNFSILQYPGKHGQFMTMLTLLKAADNEIKVAVAADILSLVKLTPPGEIGAAVGNNTAFRNRWVTVDHTPLILLQRRV